MALVVIALASAATTSRPVHGSSQHGRDRSGERNVDINEARRAVSRGDGWFVRTEKRSGTERSVYEGVYQDSHGKVPFRYVVGKDDGRVVTIIRLSYTPTRPRG